MNEGTCLVVVIAHADAALLGVVHKGHGLVHATIYGQREMEHATHRVLKTLGLPRAVEARALVGQTGGATALISAATATATRSATNATAAFIAEWTEGSSRRAVGSSSGFQKGRTRWRSSRSPVTTSLSNHYNQETFCN